MLLLAITKQSQSALIPENYGAKISNIDVADEFWNQISEILSKNLVSAAEGEKKLLLVHIIVNLYLGCFFFK